MGAKGFVIKNTDQDELQLAIKGLWQVDNIFLDTYNEYDVAKYGKYR